MSSTPTATTRCPGRLLPLAIFAASLILGLSQTASAQTPPPNNCLQDEFTLAGNSQNLNCTANDVRIAEVSNIRDPATGQTLANCILGAPFSFIADFKVVTTATSTRSNIGMYIATNSTTQARTGLCNDNVIPPPATFTKNGLPAQFPCFSGSSIMCGTNWYDEFDPAPDSCGDSSSSDNGGGVAGTQIITMYIQNYMCTPPAGSTNNQLVMPNCTSWQVPGKTIQCQAPSGQQSYNIAAIPGSPSKCNCEIIPLNIIAQTPSAAVAKACTTADTTTASTACSSGTEGVDEVTYTVTVTSNANFGTITLTKVTDSVYGTIFPTGSTTFTGDSDSGCTGTTLNPGASVTCTFTAHKYGDPDVATVTDKATATFTAQYAGSFSQDSNTVTVTPNEAPSAAKVTKGLNSLQAASITARFSVDVKNTSNTPVTSGTNSYAPDETETLTSLTDSAFGAISPTPSASITSTTCFNTTSAPSGVSLSPGSDYSCTYDATIPLASLASVEEYGTGKCGTNGFCSQGQPATVACTTDSICDLSCLGLSHSNYVTATINGDEATATTSDVVTPTRNTLNTNVCLTSFVQSQ